jgi:alanine racemase
LESVVQLDLVASIASFEEAEMLSQSRQTGQNRENPLKINTGMNRFGARPELAGEIAAKSRRLPHLSLGGAFTHFANATDKDETPTKAQWEEFQNATCGLKEVTLHVCNSAALLRFSKCDSISCALARCSTASFQLPNSAKPRI